MAMILRVAGTALIALGLIGLVFPIPARFMPDLALLAAGFLLLGLAELLVRIGPGREP